AVDDRTEGAVVHFEAAAPDDLERVDAEPVSVQEVRLQHRREQVVGGPDGVDVAGEVEVQVLHRDDLRVPAARRAALDAEDRAERRLAQAEHRPLADPAEPLRERDGRGRLPLARRRRRDRGDANELSLRRALEALQHRQVDLRLVATVQLDLVALEPASQRELVDRLERRLLRDLEAGGHQWLTAAAASSETGVSS